MSSVAPATTTSIAVVTLASARTSSPPEPVPARRHHHGGARSSPPQSTPSSTSRTTPSTTATAAVTSGTRSASGPFLNYYFGQFSVSVTATGSYRVCPFRATANPLDHRLATAVIVQRPLAHRGDYHRFGPSALTPRLVISRGGAGDYWLCAPAGRCRTLRSHHQLFHAPVTPPWF